MILLKLLLTRQFSELETIEKSIKGMADINVHNRNALLIIATEFFTNIVEHAKVPKDSEIMLHICMEDNLYIDFEYKTANFEKLLEGLNNGKLYYHQQSRRYRGLGLRMIRNLSVKIDIQKKNDTASIKIFLGI